MLSAVRYIEMNPVRAGLVKKTEVFQWSSVEAHVYWVKDLLLTDELLLDVISDWKTYLSGFDDFDIGIKILKHFSTGSPLGNKRFINELLRKVNQNQKHELK